MRSTACAELFSRTLKDVLRGADVLSPGHRSAVRRNSADSGSSAWRCRTPASWSPPLLVGRVAVGYLGVALNRRPRRSGWPLKRRGALACPPRACDLLPGHLYGRPREPANALASGLTSGTARAPCPTVSLPSSLMPWTSRSPSLRWLDQAGALAWYRGSPPRANVSLLSSRMSWSR